MIYETLVNQIVAGKLDFLSDNTTKEQPLSQPVAGGQILENGAGKFLFEQGDNIQLLSVEMVPDHNYAKGTGIPFITLIYVSDPGGITVTPTELPIGRVYMPTIVNEFVFGQPLLLHPEPQTTLSPKFQLRVDTISINVSMVNAPVILQLDTLNINVLLKIKHNQPMT